MMTVVFGYPDGRLANPTFRAYKRARRAMRGRGLDIRVELRPLGELAGTVDLLLVDAPPAGLPPGVAIGTVVVVPADHAAAEAERQVEALVTGGQLGHAPAPARTSALHRGVEPVWERARVSDRS